ncbi:MAG: histidine phosphatase family protein, partial [Spirochaetaceae bacterium]|nr:histidine phosphatase family protein [Spirochaetaceae bacterium]
GQEDARRIASELKELVPVNRIISSPLLRAKQTAEAFAETYKLPIALNETLSEQNLGPYSGMNYDEVKSEPEYQADPLLRWDWVPGGTGESYAMVAKRVKSFLETMEQDVPEPGKPENHTLIVTHAVVFRLLRGVLEDTLPRYPKDFPNNGEIWKVDFRGVGISHSIESILLGNSRKFEHKP